MFRQKFSVLDFPAKCSGRRSKEQTQALRHSICEAERSSSDLLFKRTAAISLSRDFGATSGRTAVQLDNFVVLGQTLK
jgi:hypothetical protein